MSSVFTEGEKYKVYYCKSGVYEFVLSLERLSNKKRHGNGQIFRVIFFSVRGKSHVQARRGGGDAACLHAIINL